MREVFGERVLVVAEGRRTVPVEVEKKVEGWEALELLWEEMEGLRQPLEEPRGGVVTMVGCLVGVGRYDDNEVEEEFKPLE